MSDANKPITCAEAGRLGGIRRAQRLSKRRIQDIGRRGALVRWARIYGHRRGNKPKSRGKLAEESVHRVHLACNAVAKCRRQRGLRASVGCPDHYSGLPPAAMRRVHLATLG
jgi:hypothetical protein